MLDQQPTSLSDSDLTLREVVAIVKKGRKFIILTVLGITIPTAAITICLPNTYTATATLLPVEQKNNSAMAGLLGSIGGLGMLVNQAGLGSGTASDKFSTILKSRSLNERVITKLNLMPYFFERRWDPQQQSWQRPWYSFNAIGKSFEPSLSEGVEKLRGATKLSIDNKTGLLSISVNSTSPERSAEITNALVGELEAYLKDNALSTSKRNRLFIEKQLTKAQVELSRLEVERKDFQENNRVVSIGAQAEASFKNYADLKAKIVTSEIELELLEKSALVDDPRIVLKREEISALKRQLNQVEVGERSGPLVSIKQVASLGLNFGKIQRDLMVQEKLFELLTQQYEMAKIQEAQEDISFQIIDRAIAPEKKSAPKRLLIVFSALATSIVIGIFLVFAREYLRVQMSENGVGLNAQ